MKTRLIRKRYINGNSLFFPKTKYVHDVLDIDGNKLKYIYNIPNQKITVIGDHEFIDTEWE